MIDKENIELFIELHIEQGPILVDRKWPAAIVTGIRGNNRHRNIICNVVLLRVAQGLTWGASGALPGASAARNALCPSSNTAAVQSIKTATSGAGIGNAHSQQMLSHSSHDCVCRKRSRQCLVGSGKYAKDTYVLLVALVSYKL